MWITLLEGSSMIYNIPRTNKEHLHIEHVRPKYRTLIWPNESVRVRRLNGSNFEVSFRECRLE